MYTWAQSIHALTGSVVTAIRSMRLHAAVRGSWSGTPLGPIIERTLLECTQPGSSLVSARSRHAMPRSIRRSSRLA